MEHKKGEYAPVVAVLLVGVFILSLQSLAAVSAHVSSDENVSLQSVTEAIQPLLIEHGSLVNATLFLAGTFQFDQHDDPGMLAFVENLRIRATSYVTSDGAGEADECKSHGQPDEEMLTETRTFTSIYTDRLNEANTSSPSNFERTPLRSPFSLFL